MWSHVWGENVSRVQQLKVSYASNPCRDAAQLWVLNQITEHKVVRDRLIKTPNEGLKQLSTDPGSVFCMTAVDFLLQPLK